MTTIVKLADPESPQVWKNTPEFSFFMNDMGELVLMFGDGTDRHCCQCYLTMTDLQILQCMLMADMKEKKP